MKPASSSISWMSPRFFVRRPIIADLKPGGRFVAKDMFEAGGMPVLMKVLLDGGLICTAIA